MKFGKEFASQMVQEWQEAYMDYNSLKNVLKDILRFRRRSSPSQPAPTARSGLKRRVSLYRAFSGLTGNRQDEVGEDEVILVTAVQRDEGSSTSHYQTKFLMSSEVGGEYEAVFFRRLDDEFNRVIKFYKDKVDEIMKEANNLNKQMDALIALRIRIDIPSIGYSRPAVMSRMDVIQEVEMKEESLPMPKPKPIRTASPIEVLDHVKINVEAESPVSTLKKIFKRSNSGLNMNKEELSKVEHILKQAFIEFHQQLRLLKSYSFLNQLAFSKIMKKYDKITSRNASKAYLQTIDDSFLGNSDEVSRLIERVEATYIKHFSNGNRRKGMKTLRPQAKREKHRITFFMGLFFGCSIALLLAIVVLMRINSILNTAGGTKYMDSIFPLYSFFGFIVLHMLMYGGNIYYWRRYRVNYSFIFGFKPGTELGYREVLLLASGLSLITLIAVISNFEMEIDPMTKSFPTLTELVPLGLLTGLILVAFCPFNILYRSNRFFFIKCAFHCLLAPLYKVTLPDFFLGDQLTSQVQALRCLQFYVCYYGWGDFRKRDSVICSKSGIFDVFTIVVAVIPYWIRFLQCVRRLVEEKDKAHILNGIKYFSTIIAITFRALNEQKNWASPIWKLMALISSIIATLLATYWDIVVDWGLLRSKSKNRWLRDKLVIPQKRVYFIAIVANMILRVAWMQSVLGINKVPFFHRRALIAIVACLEIIRRGIWNFFRLENEHLNNVGKYRAFKSVPLPFNYHQSHP
ncbi:phosphate transporter PHO1 homolog 9-like [Impatiens glandulifera]|uniref:phosphate transporter PHO1 homolog 9-like n=1 Tax=Impatiens glandulifera TaxID=253017 RepID=UPI001FB083D7|nr:phosphate transporter PHO1 homolog 9-like [Impatiens glandulifera]